MVCCIQRGLHALTEAFCRLPITKRGKGQVLPLNGSCLRVELSYTYLITLFALHCPSIIQPGEKPPEGIRFAHLRRFENSQWERKYVSRVRRLIHHYDVYSLIWCFPHISGAGYGEEFHDVIDGHSSLGQGILNCWSASGHPICYIDVERLLSGVLRTHSLHTPVRV